MKILKWILIVIVAIVGIFLIYSASQPNKIALEESIVIDAPATAVFAEIMDFKSWDNWSAWNQLDPDMEKEYTGEPGTVGYSNAWKSQHPMVGNGRQEIVEIAANEMMKTKLNFEGWDGTNYATFTLTEEDGKTTVSWNMDGAETPFYMNFMNSMIEPNIRDSYQKSLNSLKEVVESKPAEIANPMNLEVKEVEAINILSIKDSTDAEGISEKLKELYTEISIFMATNKVESAGMPLALYHSYSPEKVVLEAAIPYSGEASAEGRIMVTATPAGKAVMGVHYGDYNGTAPLHEAMEAFVEANKFEYNVCWEVYANDPTTVDSADVETQIYYSVN